ncbi:MAG: helix-hairpin-helix domain-containing protein [Promethearchaeota archaeon]|jgi:FKBP-type peptidyl-prolyl cis-trans isomerase 2
MNFNLSDVKGVGKKEDTLKEAGIDTIEKLAKADIDELIKLKGIGKATAEKLIESAKNMVSETSVDDESSAIKDQPLEQKTEEKIQENLKKLEEKKAQLQSKKVEEGDFVLVKITGRTQKGTIFRVSSEEDAKKAGIYDEKKANQGFYTPEFVIVGKPGFLNEGLTETIKDMKFFEKKSVRIPPTKGYGKRDPQKIERVGIAKFRRLNEGKNPELGQDFMNKKGERGVITNVVQGRVIIDYNHPLAGQSLDYNLEIVDIIENFDEKIEYFMINKGIPKENISDFKVNYVKDEKALEITIPKMFLFQNLTYVKFGLAMDLQTHMSEDIDDVKFIEVFEKMPMPTTPSQSVMEKVEEFNKEEEKALDEEN